MFFLQYAQIYPKLLTSVNGLRILVGACVLERFCEVFFIGRLYARTSADVPFYRTLHLSFTEQMSGGK